MINFLTIYFLNTNYTYPAGAYQE